MKIILIITGCVSLALGCIGAALPVLPTVPFLLLAGVCFGKSSKRLDEWFRGTRLYKDNLESVVDGRGMTRRAKLRVMGTVSIIMLIGFIAMKHTPVGRVCLAAVWVGHVIIFRFVIKTCGEESVSR